MVFKILLVSFLFVSSHADILFDEIKNLMGSKNYKINKILIYSLFKNRKLFYIDKTHLKYEAILEILKDKGLLHLRYNRPSKINIDFITNTKSIKSIRIINDVLNSLGYSYYFTDYIQNIDDELKWSINLRSDSMIDPHIFVKELNSLSARVLKIEKLSSIQWKYIIDFDESKIPNATSILNEERVILKKPLKAYMIRINQASNLQIKSRRLNNWYPYITFYDNDLKLLKTIQNTSRFNGINADIPEHTKYIRISDTYTLLNIKRGLTITVR